MTPRFLHQKLNALLGVIAERAGLVSPEQELWLTVLGQAIFDAHLSTATRRRNDLELEAPAAARRWFGSPDFVSVCDLIGADARWVTGLVERFALLVDGERERSRGYVQRRLETRRNRQASLPSRGGLASDKPNHSTAHRHPNPTRYGRRPAIPSVCRPDQ